MTGVAGRTGPLHLAFAVEGNYVPHAAAMLHSLRAANPGEALHLHLLSGPAPLPAVRDLARWAESLPARVTLHLVEPRQTSDFPDIHFHRSVWYRTLLPELLPDENRILYLDVDTLVLDRLRPLWETDLAGHLFAAVSNPLYPFMHGDPWRRLGLPGPDRYLNSGVLLLDLAAMRREGAVGALRKYAAAHPENRYPEQDAMSALFHGRCLFLHPRWNVQTTLYDLRPRELPFPPAQVEQARRNPAVVHFIGPFKPDHYLSRNPHGAAYLEHRRATPWPPGPLAGRGGINRLLRRLPMHWQFRYFVARAALLSRIERLRSF